MVLGALLLLYSVLRYVLAVSNELLWALDGLVEESEQSRPVVTVVTVVTI